MALHQRTGKTSEIIDDKLLASEIYFAEDTHELFVGIPENLNDINGTTLNHPLFGHVANGIISANRIELPDGVSELFLNGSILRETSFLTRNLTSQNNTIDLNHSKLIFTHSRLPRNALGIGLYRKDTASPNVLRRIRSDDLNDTTTSELVYAPGVNDVVLESLLRTGTRIAIVPTILKNDGAEPYGDYQLVYSSQWTASNDVKAGSSGYGNDVEFATVLSVTQTTIILDTNVEAANTNAFAIYPVQSRADDVRSLRTDTIESRDGRVHIGPFSIVLDDFDHRNQIESRLPQGRYDTSRVYSTHPFEFRGRSAYGFQIFSRDPLENWNELDPRKFRDWTRPISVVHLRVPVREIIKSLNYSQKCRFLGSATASVNELLHTEQERAQFDFTPKSSGLLTIQTFNKDIAIGRNVEFMPHQESLESHQSEAGYDFTIAPPNDSDRDWALSDVQNEDLARQTNDAGVFRNYVRWRSRLSRPSATIRQLIHNDPKTLQITVSGQSNDNPDPTHNIEIENYNTGVGPEDRLPEGALQAVSPASQNGFEITNTRVYFASVLENQDFVFTSGPYERTEGNEPWLSGVTSANLQERKSRIWHTVFMLPNTGFDTSNIIDWIGFFKPTYGLQFDNVGQQCLELGKLAAAIAPGASLVDLLPADMIHLQDEELSEYKATRPEFYQDFHIQDARVWIDYNHESGSPAIVFQVILEESVRPIDFPTLGEYFHQKESRGRLLFSFKDRVSMLTLDEMHPASHIENSVVAGQLASRYSDPQTQISTLMLTEFDRVNSIKSRDRERGITILNCHPYGLLDLWTYEILRFATGKSIIVNTPATTSPQRTRYINIASLEAEPEDFTTSKVYGVDLDNDRWKRDATIANFRLISAEEPPQEYTNSSGLQERPSSLPHAIIQGGGRQIIRADLDHTNEANILEIKSQDLFDSFIFVSTGAASNSDTTRTDNAVSKAIHSMTLEGFLPKSWKSNDTHEEFEHWNKLLTALILPDPSEVPSGSRLRIMSRGLLLEELDYTALCFRWSDSSNNAPGIPWSPGFVNNNDETLFAHENAKYCYIPVLPRGSSIELVYTRDHNDKPRVDIVDTFNHIETVVYKLN